MQIKLMFFKKNLNIAILISSLLLIGLLIIVNDGDEISDKNFLELDKAENIELTHLLKLKIKNIPLSKKTPLAICAFDNKYLVADSSLNISYLNNNSIKNTNKRFFLN